MIKLKENKSQISVPKIAKESTKEDTESTLPDIDKTKNENSNLYKFSQLVLKTLLEDSVQPTPENFDIYFGKLLELESASFQKKVLEILDYNKDEPSSVQQALLEKEVKQGFGQIKGMLQVVTLVYKNLVVMKNITKKSIEELKTNTHSLEAQSIVKQFFEELNKLNALMERHLSVIKNSYEDVNKIFKAVEQRSIYDSKFGVYNKKFFLKTIEEEISNIKRYHYNTSVMLVHPKDNLLDGIVSLKDKNGILRNIAKILLKTSRRSDIVSHYDNGCFGMVMKHTDIESAKKACERVASILYQTAFFIGGEELDMDIEISVIALNKNDTPEELISKALDGLSNSGKNTKLYEVVKG